MLGGVTIKDIARKAQVSYATVSRALNARPGVREEVRREVLALASDMGYTPNAIARGLVKRRTSTLGLVIPDITNPFYPEVARGVEDRAAEAGFSVFLCNTNWEHERQAGYIGLLAEQRVDGIILAPIDSHATSEVRRGGAVPTIVYVDRSPRGTACSSVVIDNKRGGLLATQHLIEHGYDPIGFIGARENSPAADERLQGFRAAFRTRGMAIREEYIELGDFKQESGRRMIRELIARGCCPRAVFAENDLLALGVMQGVRDSGLRVPEDVAVVGFDDIPFAQFSEVQLTTVQQPKYEMGRRAVETLLEQIAGDGAEQHRRKIVLEPTLVVRRSSG